ncbi:MAG TPA: GTPase [Pirellulales bacterium]|jgi:hypothetical protein|nr:GTPase [Pirellulales bacterium]
MSSSELAHLELLADVDSLLAELVAWSEAAPNWPAARHARALVRRLAQRADTLRVRLDAPLVVALLGGTGTGKSTFVNALVGAEVSQAGRQRPTTRRPTLVCRSELTPERLGIAADSVQVVHLDLPVLRDWVLIDCPDPDTTEQTDAPGTNLARLRELLPHCDVLLVATTQQKYRSARVAEELAAAAVGARLVFVQTHAGVDEDIRDDWRRVLADEYATGEMFFVDSLAALADARAGLAPRGEMARLTEFLDRELAGTAAKRIRRANFLDLVAETLSSCRERIEAGLPAVEQLETALAEQRGRLASRLAGQMRDELLASRRPWEQRLLGEVASRWGFSPFSCLLRLFQGFGALLSSAVLFRVRTPAQLALWGAMEGGRRLRNRRRSQVAEAATARAFAAGWDEGELRTASIIVDGYAVEAGLPREEIQATSLRGQVHEREAAAAAGALVASASAELQTLVARLAGRHTGWFVRAHYELALAAMLAVLLYRFGRNFFYDSWLAVDLGLTRQAQPVFGTDYFIAAGFCLLLWCGLLLWGFTSRLRRGVAAEIEALTDRWNSPKLVSGVFAGLDAQCRGVHAFRHECERLANRVAQLEERVALPEPTLGHRIG